MARMPATWLRERLREHEDRVDPAEYARVLRRVHRVDRERE